MAGQDRADGDRVDLSSTPRAAPVCPLCGRPNGCAPARTGTFDTPCWCRDLSFDAALLARVPVEQRGIACICRTCAEAGRTT